MPPRLDLLVKAVKLLHDRRCDARDARRETAKAERAERKASSAVNAAHVKVFELRDAWPEMGDEESDVALDLGGSLFATLHDGHVQVHTVRRR